MNKIQDEIDNLKKAVSDIIEPYIKLHEQITLIEKMGSVKHSYSHFKVDVDFYLFSGSQKLKSDKSFKWINIEEFDSYAFSKVNHKLKSIINDD